MYVYHGAPAAIAQQSREIKLKTVAAERAGAGFTLAPHIVYTEKEKGDARVTAGKKARKK